MDKLYVTQASRRGPYISVAKGTIAEIEWGSNNHSKVKFELFLYVAWNEETRLTAPKTKFEFFHDFERQKHALSNGPMHKAVRSKVTEI